MRLWSLHPRYLDPQGLVALWREGLLAQTVLRGATRGYRHHPQLERFRAQPLPLEAIGAYLRAIQTEATLRDYAFDATRILCPGHCPPIPVTTGQLAFEWGHLLKKLAARSPHLHRKWEGLDSPAAHPLFQVGPGDIESWERPGQGQ